jgi:hypothetical protein
LSACNNWKPLDGFLWNLVLESFITICQHTPSTARISGGTR